jgi:hypothetical protein
MAPEANKFSGIVHYNVVDILVTAMTPTACRLAASSKNHSSTMQIGNRDTEGTFCWSSFC